MIKYLLNLYESNIIKTHINDLQFGDIILTRSSIWINPIGWIIQTFLGELYSHTALYVGNGKVFQATWCKTGYESILNFTHRKLCVLRLKIPITQIEELELFKKMKELENSKYDFSALFYLFWILILTKIGVVQKTILELPDPIDNPKRFFCTQLIAYFFINRKFTNIHYTNVLFKDFLNSNSFQEIFNDLK